MSAPQRHLLREGNGHDASRVTFVELFFDLVFVFAITQLSHGLLEHWTLPGALQTAMLLLAVWWVWIYTSWFTNWLDPERVPVRLVMFALMLLGLLLAAAIPGAFGASGRTFAVCYAVMQVGRTLFILNVTRHRTVMHLNFIRITSWLAGASVFWVWGGFAAGDTRIVLWCLALAIEYAAPALRYPLPRLGPSSIADWNISGAHMAERCGLFVIIALGESILVTGATFSNLPWSEVGLAAFVVCFLGSAAMWWVYFNATAGLGSRAIERSSDPGRLGRNAYTYLHLPIVAGIVLSAVGDEMLLAHPLGHAPASVALAIAGGPALYLSGILLFKWSVFGKFSVPKALGIGGFALLAMAPLPLAPLALAALVTGALGGIAAWESIQLHRQRTEVNA